MVNFIRSSSMQCSWLLRIVMFVVSFPHHFEGGGGGGGGADCGRNFMCTLLGVHTYCIFIILKKRSVLIKREKLSGNAI